MDGKSDCGSAYGVSGHYLGAKGREYFALQSVDAVLNGEVESHKFPEIHTARGGRNRLWLRRRLCS